MLHDNQTWELVSLPPGRKILQFKWIYKTKIFANGTTTKYKAQLVPKVYSQVQGLDYNETFTLVSRMDSIILVLEFVASKRWEVHHMDVKRHQMDAKSTFLHGDLKEDIYMKQPKGYIEDPSLFCKLRKSLYGLKQALEIWYSKMDSFLIQRNLKDANRLQFLHVDKKGIFSIDRVICG